MIKDKLIALAIDEVGYTEGRRNDNKFAALAGHANQLAVVHDLPSRDLQGGRDRKGDP
jgi:hypothetical protein